MDSLAPHAPDLEPPLDDIESRDGAHSTESADADGDDRQRGAVLIEAVILMTLMLTMFFGILEFGLAIQERNALTEATRTGVRAASSLSRQDGYHTAAAEAVSASLREYDIENLTMTIYQADPNSGDPIGGGDFISCGSCYRFTWDYANNEFVQIGAATWPATNQAACGLNGQNDYVGVWIAGDYDMVTTFWSDQIDISEKAVMRLEPITHNAVCQ